MGLDTELLSYLRDGLSKTGMKHIDGVVWGETCVTAEPLRAPRLSVFKQLLNKYKAFL